MKPLAFLIVTLLCLLFAILPEIAMYATWHLISPSTEITRILLMILFWATGGGLCLVFGFLAFAGWVAILNEII